MLIDTYNQIAASYDQDVSKMNRLELFPYDGYDALLSAIASYVSSQTHLEVASILDLGIGTANLYAKILPEKVDLFGVDYSKQMLEIARLKYPSASLFCHDFLKGIPEEIKERQFDFIISTYSIHHLDMNQLLSFIHYYLRFLNPFGKIILGDIVFLDQDSKQRANEKYIESWSDASHYHVYNQLISKINEHLALSFMKLSMTTGLIIIENFHDCALQFEENLVQYKSNTVKWKSNPIRKKSE